VIGCGAPSLDVGMNPDTLAGGGFSCVSLGDLDAGGDDELLVGASFNEPGGGDTNEGIIYVYRWK